jgi:hypothetical protein
LTSSLVVGSLLLLLGGAKPGEYTERGLCDLLAGAQCHASSCLKDGKERCVTASIRCRDTDHGTVPNERASRTAACAKALLSEACGAPQPSECSDVLSK